MAEGFNVDIPDTAFDGPADTPEVSEPVAPSETPEAEVSAPVAPEAEVSEPVGETRTFDESYVKELRQESANYRTQAKPFKEAFDGVDDADRDIFLGLVQAYKSDPVSAAKEMARLAQGLLGDEPVADEAAPPAAATLTPYMTEARYAEIKRQEAVESAAAQIERDAKSLGYERGTPEYAYLLSAAQSKGGDLQAAHSYIQERQQTAIQQFVAAKTADAQNAPIAPADAAVPATGERSLKTWRDVEAAIDELF